MHIEQIETQIGNALERTLSVSSKELSLRGCTSSLGLAFLLTQNLSRQLQKLPHLVVVESEKHAETLKHQLEFFNPLLSVNVLSGFDVSPYSRLQLSPRTLSQRLRFLSRAQNAMNGEIFIAPVEYLIQRAPPEDLFHQNTYSFSQNSELPDPIPEFFVNLGYQPVSVVEDAGQFSLRGGVLDVFSPAETDPIRISLFGNTMESLRVLDQNTQRSLDSQESIVICQAREVLLKNGIPEPLLQRINEIRSSLDPIEVEEIIHSLHAKFYFPGIDFLIPYFYPSTSSVLDFFSGPVYFWLLDSTSILQKADQLSLDLKSDYAENQSKTLSPEPQFLYDSFEKINLPKLSKKIELNKLTFLEEDAAQMDYLTLDFPSHSLQELSGTLSSLVAGSEAWKSYLLDKISQWKSANIRIFISSKNQLQQERLAFFLEQMNFKVKSIRTEECLWNSWLDEQDDHHYDLHLLRRASLENLYLPDEKIIFLKDEDLLGKKSKTKTETSAESFEKQAKHLTFGDLKPNDYVVHIKHGVGQYLGLKVLDVGGAESEFIQLAYKGEDRLYLPVYRIGQLQKYASALADASLDKLGGSSWEKTKIKVKAHLKDVAAELLQLYAQRSQVHRPPYIFKSPLWPFFQISFPMMKLKISSTPLETLQKILRAQSLWID
ncbi:MAG TPA: CarD family transcriptional regulator [Pseudobdellovibrionaceae bacterium]|nr:CarD family transcriptional regulator [Pseudobdellovibrionaceae bacterium]